MTVSWGSKSGIYMLRCFLGYVVTLFRDTLLWQAPTCTKGSGIVLKRVCGRLPSCMLLTLAVLDERDARGAVGVVLDALHDAVLALPAAAHVYEAEQALVAGAPVPRCYPAM